MSELPPDAQQRMAAEMLSQLSRDNTRLSAERTTPRNCLKAFSRDCVACGDMTPAAARILEEEQ